MASNMHEIELESDLCVVVWHLEIPVLVTVLKNTRATFTCKLGGQKATHLGKLFTHYRHFTQMGWLVS